MMEEQIVETAYYKQMEEERVWELIADKLCGEDSGDSRRELNTLLQDNPELTYQLEILMAFWRPVKQPASPDPVETVIKK